MVGLLLLLLLLCVLVPMFTGVKIMYSGTVGLILVIILVVVLVRGL